MICAIQYRRADGEWWTGHAGIEIPDPKAYADGVNAREKPHIPCRVVDVETGQIWGHPGCSICAGTHEGVDGSCLI